jgi:hypothetical protein
MSNPDNEKLASLPRFAAASPLPRWRRRWPTRPRGSLGKERRTEPPATVPTSPHEQAVAEIFAPNNLSVALFSQPISCHTPHPPPFTNPSPIRLCGQPFSCRKLPRRNKFSRIRVVFTQQSFRHKTLSEPIKPGFRGKVLLVSGKKKKGCTGRRRINRRSHNGGPQATSSLPPF